LRKERHNYTAQEKVSILRRHLIEKEPVSEICDRLNLQPSVFNRWLKEFFENGAAALEQESKGSKKHQDKQERRIEKLGRETPKEGRSDGGAAGRVRHRKKSLGEI
jgi:transposase-like protein